MRYPKKAQIEVTNHCNLKCDGCLRNNMTREKGFITVVTFLKTLKLCLDFGIKEVHLHNWGEPLLHPKVVDYVEIAKALDFTVGFTTNGTLLTHDKLIELKEAGLDKLDISYNKNSKDERTLRNLYWISNDLEIETWFRSMVFSKEEYDSLLEDLDKYYIRFQRGIYFDFHKRRNKPCRSIENLFVIQWDGTIVPCCAMYDNQYIYGKVEEITVEDLKNQIDILKLRIEEKDLWLENSCNHCFEIDGDFPIDFKL